MRTINETMKIAVGNPHTARNVLSQSLSIWLEHTNELLRFQSEYYGADSDMVAATAVLIAEAETILGQLEKPVVNGKAKCSDMASSYRGPAQ